MDNVIPMKKEPTVEELHDAGEDCGQEGCQQCCMHQELDHFICMDCGKEMDPGAFIDRAMDYFEGDR